uniref:Uncharacterized protein n=1 Tax=Globisporangium ultimum (strain ATCC 200006 / CBS 805.95 / DAOM BR144) TaxID=431595 RepID=K3XA67_GLOUD
MEVGFKKKSRKTAATTGRKRTRHGDDSDDHEDDQAADVLQTIEEVREDQRLRAQLLRQELQKTSKQQDASTAAASTSSASQYGLHDPKTDGSAGQKLLNLLDGQFTGQSTTTQKDQHEELLNQYIEEKLGKKSDSDAPDAAVALVSEEDALYALPDHLKPDVSKGPQGAGDENGNGGVLIWSTGIAEVELPSAFKEKTVVATKHALEQEKVKSGRFSVSSALPTNFSTDFNRHRSDYVAELKNLNKDEKRERGFRNVGKHQSSDDAAMSRFRKFESRKKFK